ncbi:caltractin-like [Drosophila hydei]|uniref:Caltractin-like n=1 Tax=Drosophila hydei TaxID=7224 RepID=A0A6J1MC51_DROHY|nr:caltractin-like [Drosophila hydei]
MEKLSKAKWAEMCNTFAILDVDGSGLLTARELRGMMRVFGYENSEEDVQRMIDAVDTDGTGKMDCAKFCAALLWTLKPEDTKLSDMHQQPKAHIEDHNASNGSYSPNE